MYLLCHPLSQAGAATVVTIVGIGNLFRGDDGAGLAVAREIRARQPGLRVIERSGNLLDLFDAIENESAVIIIDAVSTGAPAGSVFRWDASAQALPSAAMHGSTHGFGVAEAIELARARNKLPATVLVWGIEGTNFEPAVSLSADVAAAIPLVAERVIQEAICHA